MQAAPSTYPSPLPDALTATFAALADPTRRAILARLAAGDATVTEIAAPFDLSLPGRSKHLKVLSRAGLIEQRRRAQWRPCHLKAEPLRDVAQWLNDYRSHWEASFDRLDDYLREIQQSDGRREAAPHVEPGNTSKE